MTIKTFVRRKQSRMTPAQHKALKAPELMQYRSEINDIINSERPVILDIGFGMGDSLVALATKHPDCLIVGVDIYQPGIARAVLLAKQHNLTNLKVMDFDAVELLQQLPAGCLYGIQLLFPDPWPKKRHAKRRFMQVERLALLHAKLQTNGWLRVITDIVSYAAHTNNCFAQSEFHLVAESLDDLVKTKYWLRAIALKHEISPYFAYKNYN